MANGVINVDIETYKRLEASGKMPQTARELEQALEGDIDQYQQETLTYCDTPYFLGETKILPLKGLATLSALEAINSPFIDADAEEANFTETALTLYIINGGKEVLHKIMGVKRRLKGIAKTEQWAKKDPEIYDKYLNKIDKINKEFAPIEKEAIEWYNSLGDVDFNEAVALIFTILKDAWGGMDMIPQDGGNGKIEKKSLTGMLKHLLVSALPFGKKQA